MQYITLKILYSSYILSVLIIFDVIVLSSTTMCLP